MTDTVAADHIYVELSSGGLSLKNCDAESLDLSSTSGSITGSLRTPKRFNVRTASGNSYVPECDQGGECVIKTTSGNVEIYVEEY